VGNGNQRWQSFLINKQKKKMKTELKNNDLKTLVSCLNSLSRDGFSDDYKMTEAGLKSLKRERVYAPEEVKVLNFYRFEGNSDPADNSILYAIETSDGGRGTLVDAYGPYADSKISSFMQQVDDIKKKTEKGASL
jgi:hypothetical protein